MPWSSLQCPDFTRDFSRQLAPLEGFCPEKALIVVLYWPTSKIGEECAGVFHYRFKASLVFFVVDVGVRRGPGYCNKRKRERERERERERDEGREREQTGTLRSRRHWVLRMRAQEFYGHFNTHANFNFTIIIGSAEALPILCMRYNRWERERERERETEVVRRKKWDGSSETEVVRRKWRHHCRAKIGDKFALSLAKNSHLSFPPSHFPSLPSRRGHL